MATRRRQNRQNRNRKSRRYRRRGGDPITQGIRSIAPKMANAVIGPSTSNLAHEIFPMIQVGTNRTFPGEINPDRIDDFRRLIPIIKKANREHIIRDLVNNEKMDESWKDGIRLNINAELGTNEYQYESNSGS